MRFRTMAWFVGGAVAVAMSGIAAVGCSSDDSGNPTTQPEKDATTGKDTGTSNSDTGAPGTDTGTPGDDSGNTGDDSGSGGQDAGSDCGTSPTLHPSDGGSIFCPFGEGGAPHDCPAGGSCCLPNSVNGTFPESVCNPPGGCTGKTIECEATEDCLGGGKVCCYSGGQPKLVQGCGYLKATNLNYTRCETACGTSDAGAELPVCTRDDECTGGKHCVPFKTTGIQLGICQ